MTGCKKSFSAVTGADVISMADRGSVLPQPPESMVLTIGNVAKMFNVSQLVLRFYELRGLIRRREGMGGVRVYSWTDCSRIVFINKCRKVGLSLSDIAPIIAAAGKDVSAQDMRRAQEACVDLVKRLEGQRKVIDGVLAEIAHIYPV